MRQRNGFTLVELLVVVAIIVALLAILLPAMGRSIEIANRAVCASNQRQVGVFAIEWATDNLGAFPETATDKNTLSHLHWINPVAYERLSIVDSDTFGYDDQGDLIDHSKVRDVESVDDGALFCPNRSTGWKREGISGNQNKYNVRVGYFIHFGRALHQYYPGDANAQYATDVHPWESTIRVSDPRPGTIASGADRDWGILTSDINEEDTVVSDADFRNADSVSHTAHGPGIREHQPLTWMLQEMNSDGGNVSYIDGSVRWKYADEMVRHKSRRTVMLGWW